MNEPSPRPTVLFDGVCNLCNASVRFVLRHERDERLRFASLQSDEGKRLLEREGLIFEPDRPDSIVLIDEQGMHIRSDAALRIAAHLRAPWRWVRAASILPRGLRDALYRWVARNRYRWFGKRESCGLPTPELRERFLEQSVEGPGERESCEARG